MTNWLAVAWLTATLFEVAVNDPALVLKTMFIVSALLYERLVKVAMPPERVKVVVPWMLAVPLVARVAVMVWVLSLITILPKASCSLTTGPVANGTPATAVAGGWVVMTN